MMSLFGLHRRLRGAIVGHLAAFEMTSSIPNRLYGDGFRRLGYDAGRHRVLRRACRGGRRARADRRHVTWPAASPRSDPDLLADIMFGAAACLTVDGMWAGTSSTRGQRGESSLREPAECRGMTPPAGQHQAYPNGPLLCAASSNSSTADGRPIPGSAHGGALPLRDVGDQAVLRRHPQGDRIPHTTTERVELVETPGACRRLPLHGGAVLVLVGQGAERLPDEAGGRCSP